MEGKTISTAVVSDDEEALVLLAAKWVGAKYAKRKSVEFWHVDMIDSFVAGFRAGQESCAPDEQHLV